jgi:hypothetical protein
VVVITDLQAAGWDGETPVEIPPGMQVEVRDVGAAPANAAVTGAVVRDGTLVATVSNGGTAHFGGTLRVTAGGRTLASAPVAAGAGRTVDVQTGYRVASTGAVSVILEDPGGLAGDDARHLVLDARERTRLLVLGSDRRDAGFYLTRALASADDGFDIDVRPAAALGSVAAGDLGRYGAVVVLSTRGMDRRARGQLTAFVKAGGGLLAAAAPDVDPETLAALLEWPGLKPDPRVGAPVVLAATDLRHPVLRAFGPLAANLAQATFDTVWRIPAEGWETVARFTDGTPALLERREGEGRVLLFASDVDRQWNDFPLQASFVPFVVEAVRYVAAPQVDRREFLVARPPAGAAPVPGLYAVGDPPRTVAVNVDPRESMLRTISAEAFTGMLRRADAGVQHAARTATQAEARQSLWRYGLLLMLLALAGESLAGRR